MAVGFETVADPLAIGGFDFAVGDTKKLATGRFAVGNLHALVGETGQR